jgi:hypothetical protein
MQCPACGVEAIPEAVFCHKCGERLSSDNRAVGQSPYDSGKTPSSVVELRQDNTARPEEELWRGGFSTKAMLGGWVLSAAISGLLLFIGIVWMPWTAWWWLLLLLAMLAPWAYHISLLCYRRMSVRYILTSQRFIHESGILRCVNDRIELLDMSDISFEQGIWERLVGVGTIRILSTDRSHPAFELPGIEDVRSVAAIFDNARIAERRRRGLHVEQI